MNSYLFEMYQHGPRGIVFLGYKRCNADSTEAATLSVQKLVADNVTLCQVYINPGDPYSR